MKRVFWVVWIFCSLGVVPAWGQLLLREGMEGPEPKWKIVEADTHYQLLLHRRTTQQVHQGSWCEELRLVAGNGTFIHAALDLTPARVIEELVPSLWVRSNRAGLQLLAVVRLPRTLHPRTQMPAEVLLPGESYQTAGRWQKLSVRNLPTLLQRQAQVLRFEWKQDVDVREAELVQLRINVYGGPGTTHLWLDDLTVAGFVPRGQVASQSHTSSPGPPAASVAPSSSKPQLARQGDILLVGQRPWALRAVRYRGESLEELRHLGINALWLAQPPQQALVRQANKQGLWLVVAVDSRDSSSQSPLALDKWKHSELASRLIAWDLGAGYTAAQFGLLRQWVSQVRSANTEAFVIAAPQEDLRRFSRHLDVLYLDRPWLGTSLGPREYFTWLLQRRRLALPGTPFWTVVATQANPGLLAQAELWSGRAPEGVELEYEQLLLHTLMAVASGSRGVLLESQSPLDAPTVAARNRKAAVGLCLLYLQLADPWIRWAQPGGTILGQLQTSSPSPGTQVVAGLLRTQGAMLLVPLVFEPGSQCVPGPCATGRVSFLVPGVPETYDAYELTPVGLRRVARRRVAGGVQVQLDRLELGTLILLTQDPVLVDRMARFCRQVAPRAAELLYQCVAAKLQRCQRQTLSLQQATVSVKGAQAWLNQAQALLVRAQSELEAQTPQAAWRFCSLAAVRLRMLQRAQWELVKGQSSPGQVPATVAYDLLASAAGWKQQLRRGRFSPNLLPGGDCENLQRMTQAGWQHFRQSVPGVQSSAELSAGEHHTGQYALRLRVWPQVANQPPTLVDRVPVWVRTPGISAQVGQQFRLRFWVRIDRKIRGTVDGLLVVDSLGGPALAWRATHTRGWQQVVLYRAAAQPGVVQLTFALTGVGEVWIDDVQIERLDPPQLASSAGPGSSSQDPPFQERYPGQRTQVPSLGKPWWPRVPWPRWWPFATPRGTPQLLTPPSPHPAPRPLFGPGRL